MAADPPPFTGAVLAGGRSSRMGTDKALLELRGRPMVMTAVEALRDAGAAEVFVIGGDGPALRALGLEVHPDDHPGQGPLGAILTAMRVAAHDPVMVLACDMPDVDGATVAAVVAALVADAVADVAAPVRAGRRQILTAAYRARAASQLGAGFAVGERAPRRALGGLVVVEVTGLDAGRLADVDRPGDLRRYAPPDAPAGRPSGEPQ